MFQRIVERQVHQGFAAISRGDFDTLLKQFSPQVHFSFAGDHAMGGEFHHRETVRQWFQRIKRIFPGLEITAQQVVVSGMPWDMQVVTKFQVRDMLADGTLYRNQGVQMMRIRWGQVVEDHLLEDTQYLVNTLGRLAGMGVSEASAPPLKDAA
ncbi:MAG: nuclear transport factor 2 family protein [Anaerolineae bacterium]|nr:nuclear transport factor 2 family protein [Anaerolineae bacterium]